MGKRRGDEGEGAGIYKSILLWVFQHRPREEGTGNLLFSQADLRQAAKELGVEVRNYPDLTYNLRSRSALPPEIIEAGFTTIAVRGRGQYALVTAEDKIEIPPRTKVIRISTTAIPWAVRDILRADEQSILSAVRYLDIVSHFMGVKCYHLQGHLRTSGALGQQVEADDVWVAAVGNQGRQILPIEAKGPRERLGRHQMMSTIDAVVAKIPGFPVVPLAVQLEPSGLLVVVRFDYTVSGTEITAISPGQFKRYRFDPKLPLWP